MDRGLVRTVLQFEVGHGHLAQEVERVVLVTGRLLVQSPAPPSVEVSLSKAPHASCPLAWSTPPLVCECEHEWVNVRQHCKAL